MDYIIRLPLAVKPSKSWFYVNMNNFRNVHPFLLNKAKIMYKDAIQRQVDFSPVFSKVKLTYTYYPRDKRMRDLGNVCSVHDKFFADAFVEAGKLPDDNQEYIPEISFRMGCVDKDHPRVEVLIEEIGEMKHQPTEQDQMQITLDEGEIHEAIKAYVRGQITIAEDQQIDIDMKAGRAENGFTATLNIRSVMASTTAAPKPTKTPLSFAPDQRAAQAAISTGEEREDPNEVMITGGVGGDGSDIDQAVSGGAVAPYEEVEEVPSTSTTASGHNPFAGTEDGPEDEPTQEPEAETPVPVSTKKPGSIFGFTKPAA